jgi:hypothetical protein
LRDAGASGVATFEGPHDVFAPLTNEMMHTIAACGTPAEIAAHIRDRVDGISNTVYLYQAAPIGLSTLAAIIDELDRKG